MPRLVPVALAMLLIPVLTLAAACGDDNDTESTATTGGAATSITATEKDFSINLDKSSVDSGKVSIEDQNKGATQHELVVFKTDLAEDKLPMKSDEPEVDEDKLDSMGEVEDIDPGKEKSFTVDLKPGKYVLICNLPGHYKLGMHTTLTVK